VEPDLCPSDSPPERYLKGNNTPMPFGDCSSFIQICQFPPCYLLEEGDVTLLRAEENFSQSLSDSFEFPDLHQSTPQPMTTIPLEATSPALLKKIGGQ